jgi:RND family efflux transporter MFP subunit
MNRAMIAVMAALWIITGASSATRAQPAPTPVFADTVVKENIQQRRLVTGELRAIHRAQVAIEEPGIVAEVMVREGDRVEKGDVLMRIDDRRLRLSVDEVLGELAEAKAGLEEGSAQAEYWARETTMVEEAASRGAATEKELRDARYEARISAAQRDGYLRTIERIEARVALLRQRLEDAVVPAPFTGVIVERLTEVGAWVNEGDPAVVLLGIDQHEAWLDVPQGLLPEVVRLANRPENEQVQRVIVRIDATGESFELSRLRVVPEAVRAGRTFTLVGVVDGPEEGLLAGGSVVAYVPSGAATDTLTVSKDAVLRGPNGPYVMAIREGEQGLAAFPSFVQVLFETEQRVAIAQGALQAGDRVVTEGAERLWPGSVVMVAEPPVLAESSADQGEVIDLGGE